MRQRFEDVTVRLFVDDEELAVIAATSLSWETRTTVEATHYQGRTVPFMDSVYEGEQFSFDCELPPGAGNIERVIEAFVSGVKDRSGDGRVRLVITARRPGSSEREAWRFDNVQLSMSRSSGSKRPLVRTISGQASEAVRVQ